MAWIHTWQLITLCKLTVTDQLYAVGKSEIVQEGSTSHTDGDGWCVDGQFRLFSQCPSWVEIQLGATGLSDQITDRLSIVTKSNQKYPSY